MLTLSGELIHNGIGDASSTGIGGSSSTGIGGSSSTGIGGSSSTGIGGSISISSNRGYIYQYSRLWCFYLIYFILSTIIL